VTLHQLRVFATVARHKSFTRAAEDLAIAQPTVSSQVKQLSKSLEIPLFEQLGKQVQLTEAGEALLAVATNLFDQLDRLEMQLADLKGARRGRLRLAAVTTAKYFVPRLLGAFCSDYPDIDIALVVTNHDCLATRIANNQDDLYILSEPPADLKLELDPFLNNPLVPIARRDSPLAQQHRLPIQALHDQPFIMREQGSGTRRAVEALLATHQVNVRVRLELGSNEAIKQAIAGGLGISVLSQHVLTSEPNHPELAILAIEHFPIARRWYVAHRSGKQLSTLASAFRTYLLERGRAMDALEQLDRDATTRRGTW